MISKLGGDCKGLQSMCWFSFILVGVVGKGVGINGCCEFILQVV